MSWSEQSRAAAGERMRERHRLGIIAQSLGPEVRARMSAARKKALSDPEVRARMSAASKKALSDPEVRARMSAARKKALSDPEVRARMSAASKKAWSDPEVRARRLAWCPPDMRDLYAELVRKVGAETARRAIQNSLPKGQGKAAAQ